MRTKVTLILIFLNVALFGYIFYVRKLIDIEDKFRAARTRVFGPESANIQTLTLMAGDRTVVLAKHGENWSVEQPFVWPANPHAVSSMLKELQLLEHETSFPVADLAKTGMALADYGLDHPSGSIHFTTSTVTGTGETPSSKEVVLQLGKSTADGNRIYVLSPDGTRIHVVDRSLGSLLTTPIEEIRSDELLSLPAFSVKSLNLQNAANLRIRVRRDGDRWAFETPIDARASKTITELVIASLNALRVKTFISQPITPEQNPATAPSLRITLEGNNRSETLLLGAALTPDGAGETTDFYAQIEKGDYKSVFFTVSVPNILLQQLRQAQKLLRESHLYDFDPATVTGLTLRAPRQPELILQRVDASTETSAWQIIRRNGDQTVLSQPADTAIVQDLLARLTNLSALEFVSDAPARADEEAWGFNQPEREIVLTTTTGTSTLRLGVGAERGAVAYAQFADARFVYSVDAEILHDTPVEPMAWRARLLRELPAGARITALSLRPLTAEANAAPLFQHQLQAGETWEQALATEPESRQKAAQALLAQLRHLQARAFAGDHFSTAPTANGHEQPWKYKLQATVVLEGGAAGAQINTLELLLSERIGGSTQLAGAQDLDAVFEVEQPFIDALWTFIYGPQDPGPTTPAQS